MKIGKGLIAEKQIIADTGQLDGFFARPEDAAVIVEARGEPYKRLGIREGDVVLDLGAHIGTFARYAVSQGASEVVSIEPHPETYALLLKNAGERVYPVLGAAAAPLTVPLYVARVTQRARSIPGRDTGNPQWHLVANIAAIDLQALVNAVQPDVIKSDIEGEESRIFPVEMPSVRALAIEVHYDDVPALIERVPRFLDRMKEAGWQPHEEMPAKKSFAHVLFYTRQ